MLMLLDPEEQTPCLGTLRGSWLGPSTHQELDDIFGPVLGRLEHSQPRHHEDLVFHVAGHHLAPHFLVLWHGQVKACVDILNLPVKQRKAGQEQVQVGRLGQ